MAMFYPCIFQIILWLFLKIVAFFYLPFHILRLFKKNRKCPPITNPILMQSATTLSHRIRQRQLKSEEVVKAYISRIQEVNPILNAVMEDRFELALKEAKEIDNFLSSTELSVDELKNKHPLLGVPLTVKGSIAVAGMEHNGGRADYTSTASADGIPVQRAKDAGAIPLLRSNIPELCLNWETTNKLIGTTRNPYNSTRTAGGSSGGEASLLGCGASLIGIGSDIAGSLRLPAHYCGVWGHKPSPYAVSELGHYPDCKQKDDWNKVFTLGPLARYAADLRLLLNVIVEPNVKTKLRLNDDIDITTLKIYYFDDGKSILCSRTKSAVKDSIKRVIRHFEEDRNVECEQLNIPLLKYSAELSYTKLLHVDDVDYPFETKSQVFLELLKFITCTSKHEFLTICYGILRAIRKIVFGRKSLDVFNKNLDNLKRELLNKIQDNGVIICPSFPLEATHHGDVLKNVFNYGYLSLFNVLGFPVTNCPISITKSGLPIGIQVASGPDLDRLTLKLAEELEDAFGGWNPPCNIEIAENCI